MTISVGDTLPEATLSKIGAEGPEAVSVSDLTKGRKVVIFAVPGAYTPTCHSAHVPSFIRTMDALKAKGVDEVVCLSVNDAFVMKSWGEDTGAAKAGITMLSDGMGELTEKLGLLFDAPPVGLKGRSKRYAMMVEDGVVKVYHPETGKGCEISGGEAMVEAL
ncbi:peroxiredoxin [Pararhodobacter aggregans]|uniref:Glutathione-dependent peroxiredoxin n=1 Tax=Pararhodobacter aggregans TaxID=404875 RepID=A0A2T7UVN5_9RHOB|nr:peroxiredoxin [Pararhodobacter aggregans]PTW99509.1 thiol peroxidase (atypical 2-Cys peroxiredoxin) [Pararhodobacter aggregans]PVE48840.1 peroxiredoxin [Pararhodobacter aggregans]